MLVGRWEGGAAGRLREAAMRLYAERGYEQTTVADIASEAGLTARTFFRHFADKREVLFAGSDELRSRMAAALDAAPAEAGPMTAVGAALDAAAEMLDGFRDHSRRRQALIYATPELMERELSKMASLASSLTAGLRRRGVPEPDASLAAEAGTMVFRVAFEQYVSEGEEAGLGELVRSMLERLPAVTAAR
ncbi:helix-turn-helix domain-containing protein [Actinoplanes sp. CA-030573]|uniref:TetR/AcrR family transcriptional regulator n=1 Tax=Actinoplanes sp. CA-030573 TaxID=3239898 RepID=UPI003D8B436C